jgi:nucleotide-binding universal stress UspA family protein/GNAT superfamily N-acetyltransferase
MFERVLIPTDLSDASRIAAERVGEIPGVREAILFHAREPADSASQKEPIARMLEVVQRQGIPARALVVDRDGQQVPEMVLQAAAETGAAMIVMGLRDQGLLKNVFGESVAAAVIRDARVHVLVIPASAGNKRPLFSRILAPSDLSPIAPELRAILETPNGGGTTLLLHAADPARIDGEKEAEKRLAALAGDLGEKGRKIGAMVRTGLPARTICAAASETDASLVVIPRIGKRDAPGSAPLGSVTTGVLGCAKPPVLIVSYPIRLQIRARELQRDEFGLAEEIWTDYHQMKGDPAVDRIFGVFADGILVSVARCRRHPDGYDVDGVFTPVRYRGRGYARMAMDALVEACHNDTLYMHSVRDLVDFYGTYGFQAIPENDLPPTIRARYAFALGEMEGSNVQPMRRMPGWQKKRS